VNIVPFANREIERQGEEADTASLSPPLIGMWGSAREIALYSVGVLFLFLFATSARAQTFGCTPTMVNDIVCENSKPGNPASQWDVSTGDAGDPSIQGFATDISVAQGGTISFKVKTNATSYGLDIYRMGYYGGNGARLITSINPSVSLPQSQPACKTDSSTNLYDCGNWAVSASWTVPSNATSGIYFVHLVRADTGGDSHIVFVVRNDSSHSDVLFQTSDEAWQAYNDWGGSAGVLGGNTLYGGPGAGNWDYTNRAHKVSYNRPFDTRSFEAATWLFGSEYPMVRWLEANGYDVTYFTHVDGVRNASLITNHRIYMSTGHDEYWTGTLRANIESARDAGVNLAFFSGNEVFWKTRWENSIDGASTPYRTLVCYKETFSEAAIDPLDPPTWTGTWRDPTLSPPADGGRPENNFTGTLFMVNGPGSDNTGLSIKVPAADGKMRFWRNTTEASLGSGATATLPAGTLGYEWDVDPDNGFRPAGTFDLSTATYNLTSDYLVDNGVTYGAGTATHHMTLHRAASGALVFGAGTVQWSWGLDSNHDNDMGFTTPAASKDMQQATTNLFADMGVQPATIQGGLLLATKSSDTVPPVSTITSPTAGAHLNLNVSATVSGTASDSGGGVVGGVEVSVDGGQSWHPASGRASWTYSFTPQSSGAITILSRAVDDSGNIETPGAGVSVTAGTTYSITGTISPTTAGNGATVQLTGTASATVTANSSGVYTFSGLATGSYTVTPSRTGYTFNPASSAVTVNNANVTGVNFTGSQSSGTTYSISGSVTPAASGSGVTITLTGAASASTVTDASGNFSIAGLANGAYTVTPSKLNFAFSPTQRSITIASANVSGVGFTATATAETLFTSQTPAQVGQSDGTNLNYELGTSFQSGVAGQITSIRFWKDANETGTHTGKIWSSSGALLATVTFAGETASGWQQQALSSPLSIAANTTYVVSVNTGNTYYVCTTSGLASQVVSGDLHSVVGNNGVYGTPGQFPTNSYSSSNYFRDVVFAPGTVPVITATAGTPQNATISAAFTTALQATVLNNGSPMSGATVTFTAPASGASGSFSGSATATAPTNSSGVAMAPTFTANSTAGGYTVTATVSGANTPASFSLTNNPGSPASITATAGTPQSAAINAAFTTALQATVKDAGSNPISGVMVTFTAPASGASGAFSSSSTATATTNSTGVATAPAFTANSTTGSYTVTASVSGVVAAASFSLTNTTAPPASIAATAGTPQSATISTAFAAAMQATVLNSSGSPVSGVTVTFTAPSSGASGAFAGGATTATTNGNGVATAAAFTANSTAGSYTVTASVSGVATPASFSLTNNPGSPASVTATAGTSQSAAVSTAFATALQATVKDSGNNPVSGVSVTFTAPTSGASGAFSGSSTATATTNSSGVATAPTFTANSTTGSYTVTASVSGVATAASFSLTNTGGASIAIDVTTSTDRSTSSKTIASSAFSTSSTNELLLAFISTDAPSSGTKVSVSSISGGSLTWTLVQRTNAQAGTAEIWRAFATAKLSSVTVTATLSASEASSMTVMSFTGASTAGTNGSGAIGAVGSGNANPGAPTASLITTQANSWVIGVGNDWDNGTVRTLGANQTMVHQYLATVGDTYWVQRVTSLAPAGTTVTVSDTAPATDRYNLSICEILP